MKSDERLATLETEVKNIKIVIDRVESKIDKFAEKKADRSEVDKLESRVNTMIITCITAVLSVSGFVIAKLLGWI
jgi:archaellum component FlaC